jgi:hypothetical protein
MTDDFLFILRLKRFFNQKEDRLGNWLGAIIFCLIITIFIGAFVIIHYQQINNIGAHRIVLIGKILEKQAKVHESDMGSSIDWKIIVEEKNGNQEIVFVDAKTYSQVQIGWWFKKVGLKFQLAEKEIDVTSEASQN